MITTAHYLASEAGGEMLSNGGNAIDAAVAASLALGVCEPAGSGLGGMAMAVVHMADSGRTFTLPSPCRAPALATPEAVKDGKRYRGYAAAAVPGNAAALEHLLQHYGTLPLAEIIQPAIRIAEEGFSQTGLQHHLIHHYKKALHNGNTGTLFLDGSGEPHPRGHLIRQPQLASTLQQIAHCGLTDFYRGDIADTIARDMEQNSGFIRLKDLQQFPAPIEGTPLRGEFIGGQVHTMGPPGGGIALIEMLNLQRAAKNTLIDPDRVEGIVPLARVIRKARKDRRKYRLKIEANGIGLAEKYLSAAYAEESAEELFNDTTGETSHINVMDRFGNAIAMTQSIERSFGAAVMSEELGFLYNGFMRVFKVENQRHPYYLLPGAMARSNATPTLVLRDGTPWIAIGSTGSERITSGIFEVLLRLASHSPFEAVHAPRLHCTPEGLVMLEAERFPAEAVDELRGAGYEIKELDAYDFSMGGLQLIVRNRGQFSGVSEPRRDGAALGI
jgi:gamma-glutamyltranspeptidase/glutathione hydrolase